MNNSISTTTQRSVVIDTTFLFDQYSHRGIGRFGKEVLKRLIPDILKDSAWKLHLIGFHDLEKNLVEVGLSSLSVEEYKDKIEFHTLEKSYDSSVQNYKLWFEHFQPIVDSVRPTIYFAFHFERGLPTLSSTQKKVHYIPKTVVVAHDAIPFQLNKFSSKSFFHNLVKKKFYLKMWQGVINSDLVISPSEYSKEMLVKYAKLSKEKIKVVHLGVDEKFFTEKKTYDEADSDAVLATFQVAKGGYLFFDSGVEPNKGISELFNTLKYLFEYKRTKIPNVLVMTGGHFLRGRGRSIIAQTQDAKNALKIARKLGILENIQTTGKIPDNELVILLHNAYAHVNFSNIEGFNLGPVQAMAAEVPTIVSNYSCNPEVTKGYALLVDTKNTKKTAKEIKKYFDSEKDVNANVKKAFELAKSYTWDATSEKIWQNILDLF